MERQIKYDEINVFNENKPIQICNRFFFASFRSPAYTNQFCLPRQFHSTEPAHIVAFYYAYIFLF